MNILSWPQTINRSRMKMLSFCEKWDYLLREKSWKYSKNKYFWFFLQTWAISIVKTKKKLKFAILIQKISQYQNFWFFFNLKVCFSGMNQFFFIFIIRWVYLTNVTREKLLAWSYYRIPKNYYSEFRKKIPKIFSKKNFGIEKRFSEIKIVFRKTKKIFGKQKSFSEISFSEFGNNFLPVEKFQLTNNSKNNFFGQESWIKKLCVNNRLWSYFKPHYFTFVVFLLHWFNFKLIFDA